jgi:hypothetical protein
MINFFKKSMAFLAPGDPFDEGKPFGTEEFLLIK